MMEAPSASEARRRAIRAANDRGCDLLAAGRVHAALETWQAAADQLTPVDDDLAPDVYANLGLAHAALGQHAAAIRDLLRALDGRHAARRQELGLLVVVLTRDGRLHDARRMLGAFEEAFGPHPDGLTTERLEAAIADQRARRARSVVC